jgi:hypothetical protein
VPLIAAAPLPSLYTGQAYGWSWTSYAPGAIFWPRPEAAWPHISQARQEEMARQEQEYARARAGLRRAYDEAWAQAERTLLRWLSPGQARDYRERRQFDLTGGDGCQWRILCQGQTGNVERLVPEVVDGTESILQYCAHPRGLPDPAAWLAQAMAVAHDVTRFMAVANVYSSRPATAADPRPAADAGSARRVAPRNPVPLTRRLWCAQGTPAIGPT